MEASTRLARIPSSNPAVEPKASNFNARPSAAPNTSFHSAPRAMRIPNSRSRLLTEYAAIPKMPVIDRIAPSAPSTPSANVAQGNGLFSVWRAYGHGGAGGARRAVRNSVDRRHFWIGGVLGLQAA